ncbi:hypothetical protein CY35_18G087800 [Sphagnum magellanicum]|nr:hypothetical protein CY35_18G087800 [Sphagnum magellanicum]
MLLNIHIYAVLNIHVIHENKVCNVACNLMVKWCDVRMFTTEILEGFDVQRTRDMNETVQKYGELTHAIMDRYLLESGKPNTPPNAVCPTFGEFVEHCKDFDMERVSDVFGVSTDANMALSIVEHYQTVLSLATAYSNLEGDLTAQEKLLACIPIRNKNKTISKKISRNIFKLIWAQ